MLNVLMERNSSGLFSASHAPAQRLISNAMLATTEKALTQLALRQIKHRLPKKRNRGNSSANESSALNTAFMRSLRATELFQGTSVLAVSIFHLTDTTAAMEESGPGSV